MQRKNNLGLIIVLPPRKNKKWTRECSFFYEHKADEMMQTNCIQLTLIDKFKLRNEWLMKIINKITLLIQCDILALKRMRRSTQGWGKQLMLGIVLSVFMIFPVQSIPTLHLLTHAHKTTSPPVYVHFIDVGQGDATLIEYEKIHILIDAGNNGAEEKIMKYLALQQIETLDLVIATHPDVDHIGGMAEILNTYEASLIIDAGVNHTSKTYRQYEQAVKAQLKQGAFYLMAEPFKIQLATNLTFEILPTKDTYTDRNNHSIVSKLSYGEIDVLFMGDAEIEVEHDLLNSNISAEILKVGHHGSLTSSTPEFLNRVTPEVAIISAGRQNPYGHPHRCVTNRLKRQHASIYTTAEVGDIVLVMTDTTYEVNYSN